MFPPPPCLSSLSPCFVSYLFSPSWSTKAQQYFSTAVSNAKSSLNQTQQFFPEIPVFWNATIIYHTKGNKGSKISIITTVILYLILLETQSQGDWIIFAQVTCGCSERILKGAIRKSLFFSWMLSCSPIQHIRGLRGFKFHFRHLFWLSR